MKGRTWILPFKHIRLLYTGIRAEGDEEAKLALKMVNVRCWLGSVKLDGGKVVLYASGPP